MVEFYSSAYFVFVLFYNIRLNVYKQKSTFFHNCSHVMLISPHVKSFIFQNFDIDSNLSEYKRFVPFFNFFYIAIKFYNKITITRFFYSLVSHVNQHFYFSFLICTNSHCA